MAGSLSPEQVAAYARDGILFPLPVMSEAEERMLTQFAVEIVGTPTPATPPPVLPEPSKNKGGRTKKIAAGAPSGKTRICVVCAKPFTPRTSAVTCSPECWKVRNNKSKAKSKAKLIGNAKNRAILAEVPASNEPRKCLDCGEILDNPKKVVCNVCAAKRIAGSRLT
jgi:predicted nucleic acid-binding Zn ribbon protein